MTPEREAKLKKVIAHRQPDLTVVLDNVHDPHNIFAVLRSCDAVGIQEVYIIDTLESMRDTHKPIHGRKSSSSANKWLDLHLFNDYEKAFSAIKNKYSKVLGTHLSEDAAELHQLDLTKSVALVFGNEGKGISPEAMQYVDGNFIIPQVGMISSLNISVACAVTLYECYRQRNEKGFYSNPRMSDSRQAEILERWAKK